MNILSIKANETEKAIREADLVLRYSLMVREDEERIQGNKAFCETEKIREYRELTEIYSRLARRSPITKEFVPWEARKNFCLLKEEIDDDPKAIDQYLKKRTLRECGLFSDILPYMSDVLDDSILLCKRLDYFYVSDIAFCLLSSYDVISSYINSDVWDSAFNSEYAKKMESGLIAISKFNSHVKVLHDAGMDSVFVFNGKKVNRSQSKLFFNLMEIEGRRLANALKMYRLDIEMKTSKEIRASWRALVEIYETLKSKAPKDNVCERILYLHQLESMLHMDLINHLMGSINDLKKSGYIYPDGMNEIVGLAQFARMQNTLFSGIHAQYTMDYLRFYSVVSNETELSENQKGTIFEWREQLMKWLKDNYSYEYPIGQWQALIDVLESVDAIDINGDIRKENLQEAKMRLEGLITNNREVFENPLHIYRRDRWKIGKEHLLFSGLTDYNGKQVPNYCYYENQIEPDNDLRAIYTLTREINKNGSKDWPLSCPELSRKSILKLKENK